MKETVKVIFNKIQEYPGIVIDLIFLSGIIHLVFGFPYWNYIFYNGSFFLMFYFISVRILIAIRLPYSWIEIGTITLVFLKFIGLGALLV
jgi:hypothetical protein